MRVTRTDAFRCDMASAVFDPDTGWMTVEGTAALVGVMQYDTGSEYVPAATLEDSAADLIAMPITLEHPPGDRLTAETTRGLQVGSVIAARFDGKALRVKIRITDAEAIAAVQAGKRELSPGYDVELDEAANASSYKFIQSARKYNHLAIVDRARGGRSAKLDSESKNNMDQISIMIDGVEYPVDPKVAEYIAQLEAPETADAVEEEPVTDAAVPPPAAPAAPTNGVAGATVTIKTDSLRSMIDESVANALRTDRIRVDAAARVLGDTVALCRPYLPASYRTDGRTESQIVSDTIVAIEPSLKARVAAMRNDSAGLRGFLGGIIAAKGPAKADTTVAASHLDGEDDPVEAARQRQNDKRIKVAGGTQ